jgi:two-component system KDP operon response regulator KdpE
MRSSKEVICLARRNGAETIEIKFTDSLGTKQQFTCSIEEFIGESDKTFDDRFIALTNSMRDTVSGLDSQIQAPRFACERLETKTESGASDHCLAEPETGPAVGAIETRSNAVVLIEQDAVFRGFIRRQLEEHRFEVLDVAPGDEGVQAVRYWHAGVVLVDMDIPDPYGLAYIRQLRRASPIPVLALAGQANAFGAVEALNAGASDFIVRPVNFEELGARLRAARRKADEHPPHIFRSGSLTVDLTRRLVTVAHRKVQLSVTEYSLLNLLIANAGCVVSYAQMLREVWGSKMLDKVSYLRVYLVALRKKLEVPAEPDLLVTERSVGYRLVVR